MMLLWLTACQSKSEVDKCVDAKIVSACADLYPDEPNPRKKNLMANGVPPDACGDFMERRVGGKFREQCLRAQAGKD